MTQQKTSITQLISIVSCSSRLTCWIVIPMNLFSEKAQRALSTNHYYCLLYYCSHAQNSCPWITASSMVLNIIAPFTLSTDCTLKTSCNIGWLSIKYYWIWDFKEKNASIMILFMYCNWFVIPKLIRASREQ